MTSTMTITRKDLALLRDFNDLPGNERQKFAEAIRSRAEAWRLPGQQGPHPSPMVVHIVRDPLL